MMKDNCSLVRSSSFSLSYILTFDINAPKIFLHDSLMDNWLVGCIDLSYFHCFGHPAAPKTALDIYALMQM